MEITIKNQKHSVEIGNRVRLANDETATITQFFKDKIIAQTDNHRIEVIDPSVQNAENSIIEIIIEGLTFIAKLLRFFAFLKQKANVKQLSKLYRKTKQNPSNTP